VKQGQTTTAGISSPTFIRPAQFKGLKRFQGFVVKNCSVSAKLQGTLGFLHTKDNPKTSLFKLRKTKKYQVFSSCIYHS